MWVVMKNMTSPPIIIYVNDLPGNILSSLGLFADDTKIYCPIFLPADIDMLQQDLNSLVEWCGTWLSFLNFSKCKHISIGPKSKVHIHRTQAVLF